MCIVELGVTLIKWYTKAFVFQTCDHLLAYNEGNEPHLLFTPWVGSECVLALQAPCEKCAGPRDPRDVTLASLPGYS